jgi:hypothetical protein
MAMGWKEYVLKDEEVLKDERGTAKTEESRLYHDRSSDPSARLTSVHPSMD